MPRCEVRPAIAAEPPVVLASPQNLAVPTTDAGHRLPPTTTMADTAPTDGAAPPVGVLVHRASIRGLSRHVAATWLQFGCGAGELGQPLGPRSEVQPDAQWPLEARENTKPRQSSSRIRRPYKRQQGWITPAASTVTDWTLFGS
jgi:hypothetical protein